MSASIAVTSTKTLTHEGLLLAKQLNLPYVEQIELSYDYYLQLTPKHLSLIKTNDKVPVFIDFLSGKLTYRRQHASLRTEALTRALGLRHDTCPTIVDATAGLGRDSFIIASLGFDIHMLERSPIIHALLTDAMQRASANMHTAPIIQRMHLIHTDAETWLTQHKESIDIIYLDPMFPERKKSALVKKEMRIFQELLPEENPETLLTTALTCAQKRVVVKRPRLADPIAGRNPSFSLKGTSSRFDIYLI